MQYSRQSSKIKSKKLTGKEIELVSKLDDTYKNIDNMKMTENELHSF